MIVRNPGKTFTILSYIKIAPPCLVYKYENVSYYSSRIQPGLNILILCDERWVCLPHHLSSKHSLFSCLITCSHANLDLQIAKWLRIIYLNSPATEKCWKSDFFVFSLRLCYMYKESIHFVSNSKCYNLLFSIQVYFFKVKITVTIKCKCTLIMKYINNWKYFISRGELRTHLLLVV